MMEKTRVKVIYVVHSLLHLIHIELQLPLAGLVADDAGDYPEPLLAKKVVVLLQFRRQVLLWFYLQDLELKMEDWKPQI